MPRLDYRIEEVVKARPSEVFEDYLEAAMLDKGCSNIPRELYDWITILSKSLPLRAARTCLELLIGAMLTRSGFVTQMATRAKGNNIAIPLLSRLMPTAGNTGKLRPAQTLIRSVASLYSRKTVRLLMDSWYMRGDLILAILSQEIDVIG